MCAFLVFIEKCLYICCMDTNKLRGRAKRRYLDFYYKMSELIGQTKTPSGGCMYCYFKTADGRAFRVLPSNIDITTTFTIDVPVCSFKNVDVTCNGVRNSNMLDISVYDVNQIETISENEFLDKWKFVDEANKCLWSAMPVGETYYHEYDRNTLYVVKDKFYTRHILDCGLDLNRYYLLVDSFSNFPANETPTRISIPVDRLFEVKPIIGVGISFKEQDGLPIYELYKKITGKEQ